MTKEELLETLDDLGLTQKQLAGLARINVMTVSGFVNGKHKPRPKTIRKIRVALGLDD